MPKRTHDEFDLRYGRLAEWLENNARPGSPLKAAAGVYAEGCRRDGGAIWGEKSVLARAWHEESPSEKSRILNGHNPRRGFPSPAAFKALMVEKTPLIGIGIEAGEGVVIVQPETFFDEGSRHPVRVFIAEGTDRVTAIEALRQAITVLADRWEAAVGLGDGDFLSIEPGELAGPATPALEALARAELALDNLRTAIGPRAGGDVSDAEKDAFLARVSRAAFGGVQKEKSRIADSRAPKLGGKRREKAKAARR